MPVFRTLITFFSRTISASCIADNLVTNSSCSIPQVIQQWKSISINWSSTSFPCWILMVMNTRGSMKRIPRYSLLILPRFAKKSDVKKIFTRTAQFLMEKVVWEKINANGNFSVSPFQYRMWRKNRGRELCSTSIEGEKRCCKGVDLNRNFDFQFGGKQWVQNATYHADWMRIVMETWSVYSQYWNI